MSTEQFSVTWDSFQSNIRTGMNNLLENEDFVDVTLAVEGRYLKAHKMVLSMCSPYFRDLFKTSPCKHPIVFMKDVSYDAMSDLLQFVYQGEVQVSQDKFTTFIKTAESLQIKGLRGLSNYGNDSTELNKQKNSNKLEKAESQNLEKSHHISPKRPRLSESPPQSAIVKSEQEAEQTTPTDEVELKMEPLDQENSTNGNCSDDSLDEAIDDTNEDFWMMGGVDESQSGTSGNVVLVGEESIPSDIEEAAASAVLPEKSKEKYEYTFNRFEEWCGEHDVKTINEEVLLTYFKEKSVTHKSSSLWATYSMLKSMISIKKQQDISVYKKLLAFLKKQSIGYQARKSEIFRREDFERFLRDTDDHTYLMMKVAMIIAVAGALSTAELTNLLTENVIEEGNFIRILLPDSKLKTSKEFVLTAGNLKNLNILEIVRKYMRLRPASTDHKRFFVSYRQGKCTKQAVGKNTFGMLPKNIAQILGLPNPEQYTGHCFKRTSASLKLVPQLMNFS